MQNPKNVTGVIPRTPVSGKGKEERGGEGREGMEKGGERGEGRLYQRREESASCLEGG